MYCSLVTKGPPSSRRNAERGARIFLIAGLVPLLPCEAILIWSLGFDVHPHRVAYAFIVAGIFAIVGVSGLWLVYRAQVKRASTLASEGEPRRGR